ncbi:uncharacterized protein EV420DRAFT_1190103 [Desarmillaria tabescens]|uniref:Uncharacterized protein n=1 Tax=Armillaria tabescens TaxID=1929756 RepID=A0AA39TXM9_ARMTA|nr:uncharacterized protein EV420DRAFT_1190103 [Desarmillaria tabescens]KAK0462480.1 hypothetical protein EV420DRAFT_1190103 [Desarmillaria tabescens]
MDTFPCEIWIHIFEFTCTDGGQTGRSISLVSKLARDLVQPLQLNSLCVTSARQIIGLREHLETLSVDERTVYHLLIASTYPDPDTRIYPTQIYDSLTRILRLVARTLVTLTTHLLFLSNPILPQGLPFPHLEELTLYGHFNTFTDREAIPSLRRLHISTLSGGEMLVRSIARGCPFLTHLYVLERGLSLRVIEKSLGVFRDSTPTAPSTFQLPHTIKKILVETDLMYLRQGHTHTPSNGVSSHRMLNDKIAQAETSFYLNRR